jgi:hypothetical protein
MTQFSEFSYQKEVLFDLNTTFRLENIQQDEQVWFISITAVNDGGVLRQKYIDDTDRQMKNLSIPIIFGKLICDMS